MTIDIRSRLSSLLCNLKSWRTPRKIVVFESDDWGGIRMPSKEVQNSLRNGGIDLTDSVYNLVDCLETKRDIEGLLNVLASHKSNNGQPVIFTTFNVVGNPDFKKILHNDFNKFDFETAFESYLRYNGEDLSSVWEDAIANHLLSPQFHAREHLNSALWLEDLRRGHRETRYCFDHGFCGNPRSTESPRYYTAAYWARSPEHLDQIKGAIDSGLELFQSSFKYWPTNFVACDYVLPSQIEEYLSKKGIRGFQTQRGYRSPCPVTMKDKFLYRYTGFRNQWNSVFTVRNGSFEPSLNKQRDQVGRTLSQIKCAFLFNSPAVISTHRANYVSGINNKNGGSTLILLDELLLRIRKIWPTVEFISSSELLSLMTRDDQDTP